jgi:hypothetical protein
MKAKRMTNRVATIAIICICVACTRQSPIDYAGKYVSGNGDTAYLELLDKAYRMMRPDGELENLSMLYSPAWNGFVEGPTWNAWWIQNSFGPTYTMLPFMDRAYRTFVGNSQALWFNKQGDGERMDGNRYVAPRGSLCDCANPNMVYYRQGDGRHRIHDWGYGFTAAGIILQAEWLLINREMDSIRKYLPKLEDAAEFIDQRRDPEKNIFLVGPAANLLAPSYAGTGEQLPDGAYEKAYLSEISVNYLAGLGKLIELEKMAGHPDKVKLYEERCEKVRSGLKYLLTDEGYFIRALAPDGTKHGEYGAEKYGYFDVAPNHDAMAFRIVDDRQAQTIYQKIKSIPGLRPNDLILPNYPGYDDMYENHGLFEYGRWVNGGHWTTNEARMQLGYYRVGAWQDAAAGFKRMLALSSVFRMDNNLTNFGADLYQPKEPVNVVYDSWGAPGGFLRGLFEYLYTADSLTLIPHIPQGITRLEQHFPVYFGDNRIYITVNGNGQVTSVMINGKPFDGFDTQSVKLKLSPDPGITVINIGMNGQPPLSKKITPRQEYPVFADSKDFRNIEQLPEQPADISVDKALLKKINAYYQRLAKSNLTHTYEFKHAQLILESVQSVHERRLLKQQGRLPQLAPESQRAADRLYLTTIKNLCDGLLRHLEQNGDSIEK